MKDLQEQGLIERRQGSGTYVRLKKDRARGVPGTILERGQQRLTTRKPDCLMILNARFDLKPEQNQFLHLLGQLPARLTAEQVASALNCQPHGVPVLVAAKLFKPLGNPPPNSVKFYCVLEVLEQAKDRAWLAKVKRTEPVLVKKRMRPNEISQSTIFLDKVQRAAQAQTHEV